MNRLSEFEWGNFIYLLILIVFLSISLFSRRDFLTKKTLKYALAWLGIFLVIILLYSFRFDFSDYKNRVASELNPSKVRSENNGSFVIKISKNGHFYINLKVNGKYVYFMVDTGASDIALSLSDAKRIGINPNQLSFNKIYQTANGQIYGASVTLDQIEIGDVAFKNIKASVNSADMGHSLLGMSFLRQFRKYEFYRDSLILTP